MDFNTPDGFITHELLNKGNFTYFAPTTIAYLTTSEKDFLRSIGYSEDHDTRWFIPSLDNNANLIEEESPSAISILPPDHHTAKKVEANEALVTENKIDTLSYLWFKFQRKHGYKYVNSKLYLGIENNFKNMIIEGLSLDPDIKDLLLYQSSSTTIPGGKFLGDFVIIMKEEKAIPSSARPFSIVPRQWLDIFGIEERDISYQKEKAIDPSLLEVGHWYSLPAGRLGIFVGWTARKDLVWVEMKGGYSKYKDDGKVAKYVDSIKNLSKTSYYYTDNIKTKKIKRSQYNKDHGAYTGDLNELLSYAEKDIGEKLFTTQDLSTQVLP